ncbi:gasdermin-B [Mirounga angustirostris]|uniref:gasdermin-B n=1 Tax=Mirounga angustirostris TaxID=9716 RepID=UPI001E6878F3|nr:gasdermin-B [Mirounga angustirostris]
MWSVFEEITRVVVQEMDAGGDMIAVRSILDADRFHCCSLVRGRRNFWGHQYHRTDLTLEDILERGKGKGLFDKLGSGPQGQKAEFQVLDMVDSKGMLTVKLPKEITTVGAFHRSHKQRVKILEPRIPQQYLDSLEHRELRRRLPTLLQSIRRMRADLYLVTEILEMARKETLKSERLCTLWSRVNARLGPWGAGPASKPSLDPPMVGQGMPAQTSGSSALLPDLPEQSQLLLGLLRPSLLAPRKCVWHCWKSLSLEDFRNMKEKEQDMTHLEMEGLAGLLISSLFNAAGFLVKAHTESILDILDALITSEEQHLVAEALEKGTLPLLKDQVRQSVLEQNWSEQPHDMGWDPNARLLCALCVALSLLLQLGEKPTSVPS